MHELSAQFMNLNDSDKVDKSYENSSVFFTKVIEK